MAILPTSLENIPILLDKRRDNSVLGVCMFLQWRIRYGVYR